ncbi:hypothetical protein PAXRUDRAFT_360757 [Paxillus rubicundulus Ve08.2h10]|uniref:Uncharacterized protein n=1 Tax=Paxillus rubicundulus Ve08.2h10 TaxID=930991 RepID=A0A0D0EA80_9AGAM|nr:hypothetical protein PAXRUDRAFT_360757 [Paxillus rubicundulus Ve08.2h10]
MMVYCKISTDMKLRALELLKVGWEMDEVTEALGQSDLRYNFRAASPFLQRYCCL